MKLATFNINGVNKRLANLLEWLERDRPDVACLQELKATDKQFPIAEIKQAGYHAVWQGEHLWNGVAILAKNAPPIVTRRGLPGLEDSHARYLEAAADGILAARCIFRTLSSCHR
ncbi:MAG TPA: endonuclease/exonuclease/phosphatase family protein [Kofleriaceae bacterium]